MENRKRRANYKWTPEAENRLRQMVADGYTSGQIALALETGREIVRKKRHYMGLAADQKQTSWTPERNARLIEMRAQGMKAADIARELGCSRGSILMRSQKIGIAKKRERPYITWDWERVAELERMVASGLTGAEIAQQLQCREETIRSKMSSMKLASQSIYHWTPEKKQRLIEMRGQGIPFSAIGRVLGCTKYSAQGQARELGLTKPNGRKRGAHLNPNYTRENENKGQDKAARIARMMWLSARIEQRKRWARLQGAA